MVRLLGAALSIAVLTACASRGDSAEKDVPTVTVYRHSAWEEMKPKGVDADGLRQNMAPGDALEFKDLKINVNEMTPSPEGSSEPEKVTITLMKGEESETRTLAEGDAFNWNGYHVAIVAIYAKKGDLGFGSTVFEVATLESLPAEVANSATAGGPEQRIRMKHKIDKLTLHHSATPHNPGDDLGQKLRNMQKWGESDRNWFDIPYHFIIDLDGSVLEARDYHYAGDTNTRYDTRGHFLINCYGNYSEVEPNQAQLQTIANLMAWAVNEFDIDPVVIYGHRDMAQTGCPGDNLYRYIEDGTLKQMVDRALEQGPPVIDWKDELPPR
jgi:hypothetical protein